MHAVTVSAVVFSPVRRTFRRADVIKGAFFEKQNLLCFFFSLSDSLLLISVAQLEHAGECRLRQRSPEVYLFCCIVVEQ